MTDSLLVNMALLELGIRDTLRREPYNRRTIQKAHERLVLLRDARCVAQRHDHLIGNVVKPDDERDGAPDLSFSCDGIRFVVEHTTIESFVGERRWVETDRLPAVMPKSLSEIAELRRGRVRIAFEDKLGKLASYKTEAEDQYGTAVSVLLLEFEGYVYSGPKDFMRAVGSLLEEYRERLPDEIHVVETPYLDEGDIYVPTGGDKFVLASRRYRAGDLCPGGYGPLRWFPPVMSWLPVPGFKTVPPFSGLP